MPTAPVQLTIHASSDQAAYAFALAAEWGGAPVVALPQIHIPLPGRVAPLTLPATAFPVAEADTTCCYCLASLPASRTEEICPGGSVACKDTSGCLLRQGGLSALAMAAHRASVVLAEIDMEDVPVSRVVDLLDVVTDRYAEMAS